MSRTTSPDDQPPSERRYQSVLECVDKNTGGRQPAGVEWPRVHLHLGAHGPYGYDELDESINDALDEGDLVEWPNPDGVECLSLNTEAALKAVVVQHNQDGNPETGVLEARVLPALREARDGE